MLGSSDFGTSFSRKKISKQNLNPLFILIKDPKLKKEKEILIAGSKKIKNLKIKKWYYWLPLSS